MLIAIDTATDHASLAIHDGLRVRAEHTWETRRRHTVELLPRLVEALHRLEIQVEHLSGVAVALGPGSFTGLRVGLSIAKGMALARGLPLAGIPTLDVLAAAQGRDRRPLCAILQAGRGRICAATYRWRRGEWRVRIAPRLTTWSALAEETASPTLFCGEIDPSGARTLATLGEMALQLPAAACLRRAGFLAEVAWQRINRGEIDDPATLAPLYLKQPT
jgi:tRNA threonylcarbamoyladenosine biosynthesis protein TsaB